MKRRNAAGWMGLLVWALVAAGWCGCAGRGPVPGATGWLTDSSLENDVRERLERDPVTRGGLLGVRAMGGVVEVSGQVPDATVAARVRAVVENTPGVRTASFKLMEVRALGDGWRRTGPW